MATPFERMVEEAKKNVREVSPAEAKEMVDNDPDALILDVRESHEWDLGHIPGAVLIPMGQLEFQADTSGPRPNADLTGRTEKLIVTQCATGKRSLIAADVLQKMGYKNVVSMRGGYTFWAREGLPTE